MTSSSFSYFILTCPVVVFFVFFRQTYKSISLLSRISSYSELPCFSCMLMCCHVSLLSTPPEIVQKANTVCTLSPLSFYYPTLSTVKRGVVLCFSLHQSELCKHFRIKCLFFFSRTFCLSVLLCWQQTFQPIKCSTRNVYTEVKSIFIACAASCYYNCLFIYLGSHLCLTHLISIIFYLAHYFPLTMHFFAIYMWDCHSAAEWI